MVMTVRFLFLLVGIFPNCLIGQTISGIVTDAKTGQPIETASVYFDNTTIGTVTNSEGYFSIDYTDAVRSTLVISYLGFEKVFVSNYRTITELKVALMPSASELETVYLNFDDGLTRRQKLRIFRKEFLGSTKFGSRCKILNEDDIYLKYDDQENTLTASSSQPIIVENKALNYIVSFDITEFQTIFSYINTSTLESPLVYCRC